MKFVFWQNIVSIHQSAFIKALSQQHIVTLVAEQGLDSQRMMEKWDIPTMGEAEILVNPSNDEIESLLLSEDVVHVFSGIDAYPMVYRAFKRAAVLGRTIAVMAEPYDWSGLKGKLRQLKYRWLFLRYGKYIRHFFTTGNMGILCYKKAGFPEQRLHQWGYFTEQEIATDQNHKSGNKPNLVFVGKIDERKNILALVDAALENENLFDKFQIVGTGHLLHELMGKIVGHKSISYLGVLPNEEVMVLISQSDLLVLPSLFDGWGAVVNEALSVGTRVLCSENCGAAILLDGVERGEAFKLDSIKECLGKWLGKGPLSSVEREKIKNWANVHISGEVAAEYFVCCFSNERWKAPWLR